MLLLYYFQKDDFNVSSYWMSPDEKWVLLASNWRKVTHITMSRFLILVKRHVIPRQRLWFERSLKTHKISYW